jgi:hypothetical protein
MLSVCRPTAFRFLLLPRLAGVRVEHLNVRDDRIVIEASTPETAPQPRPDCGVPSHRGHSRYLRHQGNVPCGGRPALIERSVRRLLSDDSQCSRVTFAEQVERLTIRYGRDAARPVAEPHRQARRVQALPRTAHR